MKMAKASKADLEMAMALCRYLDDIDSGYMPADLFDAARDAIAKATGG